MLTLYALVNGFRQSSYLGLHHRIEGRISKVDTKLNLFNEDEQITIFCHLDTKLDNNNVFTFLLIRCLDKMWAFVCMVLVCCSFLSKLTVKIQIRAEFLAVIVLKEIIMENSQSVQPFPPSCMIQHLMSLSGRRDVRSRVTICASVVRQTSVKSVSFYKG